ncbi:MAG: DUF5112 domain-containing protein [Phocaeicola vulgatus]
MRAEALNNIGFCAFIHMDFETAEELLSTSIRGINDK